MGNENGQLEFQALCDRFISLIKEELTFRLLYEHPGIGVGVSAPGARTSKTFILNLFELA